MMAVQRNGGEASTSGRKSAKREKEDRKEKDKEKKEKGLLSAAKAKATGSLRKALLGKSPKKKKELSRDAESIQEDDEDCTQSNYDTVKSLPATGHYGRRRSLRATPLHVDVDYLHPSRPPRSPVPPPVVPVVIRLPRRRASQPLQRISPVARLIDPDPIFDFEAWHSSLDLLNCQDAIYSLFMKAHKCYDLIPVSTKLVVFDINLPVRKAFFALVYNGVRAAPLWDSAKQQFVGMLTITDFIKILYKNHKAGVSEEAMNALEEQKISAWRDRFVEDGHIQPLVYIDPNESLYRAVQLLCEAKVHRLPVLERGTGNISYILTHKRIMKFLSLYTHDLPRPSFMDSTPRELGIGSWGDILTIHVDTKLIDALAIFLTNRVSALPLVDEAGKVVDIYAKFDVIALAAEKAYSNLEISVHEALKHRQEWFEGVRTCRETDSLFMVMENIVRAEVHRLIVTDADHKVVGIISLSDILKYLVVDCCADKENSNSSPSLSSSANNNNSSTSLRSTSRLDLSDVPVFDILPEEEVKQA